MVEITEFQAPTGIQWQGDVGLVEYGPGDAGMVVIFYVKAAHNPQKSAEAGRPIFEDQVMVKIHPPGERLNIIDRPATEDDKRRWPRHWQAYQANRQQTPDGTPIELLYPEHPSIPAMLRSHGVHTIEHAAALSSNAIDNIGMGSQRYVNDAQRYLSSASKGAGAIANRKQIEDLESKLRVALQQVDQLKEVVASLQRQQAGQPNLAAIQQLLSGVMASPAQFPGVDGQAYMINNNHPSADETRQKVAVNKTKRSRQRITR